MKTRIYEAHFDEKRIIYTRLHKLIEENYIDKVFVPGEGMAGASTDVYFCAFNNCSLVIKERTRTAIGSFADFTIAHEKSLAKIVETKSLIEKATKLRFKAIKYSI